MTDLPTLEKKASYDLEKDSDAFAKVETASVGSGDIEIRDEDVVIQKAEDVALQVISTRDDPDVPIFTLRVVFLGIGLTAFSSVLATIYTFKPQNASVSQLFGLIIAYVLGEAMASIPSHGLWRYLNPGPFNIKEHTVIVIMASTASNVSTTMEVIAALDLFYGLTLNSGVAIFQIFATQMIGYGVAGLLRSFLVYPTYAFYPTYISVVNLLQSLHFRGSLNVKKRKFFWIVFAGIFLWEWIPQYPFPLLTAFSIVCLVDQGRSKNSEWIRNLFGAGSSNEGIGLLSFGFSWTLITQGYPLVWPLRTQINSYLGMVIGYIVLSVSYYNNVFHGRDLKWMSTSLFNTNGTTYDQEAVLDSNYHLNRTALAAVGLPRYTTTFAISQLCYNLSLGSAVTSVLLWNRAELKAAFWTIMRNGRTECDDPHYLEMKKYKEVPQWAYGVLFLVTIALAIGLGYAGPNGTVLIPAWSVIFFSFLGFFLSIFIGFVTATTGFNLSVKYCVQLIAAFVHPGQPVTVMYANLFGNASAFQTLYMLQDLKLGQYIKLPPWYTFGAQMAGSIIGSIFNFTMMKSIVAANREVLVDPSGTRIWSGWIIQSLNSSAVAMGALGKDLFSYGNEAGYWIIPFCLFIGLLIPIPFYIAHKFMKPTSQGAQLIRFIDFPILCQYIGYLPYSVNGQWWTCFVIGITSQYYMRKWHPSWFVKYNYLLSAALDGGAQVMSFILAFAVFGASGKAVNFPTWWGNPDPAVMSADRCMPVS